MKKIMVLLFSILFTVQVWGFDVNSPSTSHNALSDVTAIRNNLNDLRSHEIGGSAPSNPVAGMLWSDNSGSDIQLKLRNKANTGWNNAVFPSGTAIVFFQASCPAGWTKVTTQNNKTLRIVSGTGGGSGGTTGLSGASVAGTAITQAQLPDVSLTAASNGSHTHSIVMGGTGGGTQHHVSAVTANVEDVFSEFDALSTYYATDAQGAHTHSVPLGGGGQSHTHSIPLAYIDVIICTKD